MPQPEIDRLLRNALGRYATGVAVVTTIDPDGHPVGLTINSFATVSLEPPLVLWCLDNRSHNLEAFQRASHHGINVLAADQQDLSTRFATWPVDRFAGLPWHPGPGGAPLLPGGCAHFGIRLQTTSISGDHTLFIGQIEHFDHLPEKPPLLFFGGRYRQLTPAGNTSD